MNEIIPLRDRFYISINDAATAVGVSRSKAYELIRKGRIRTVRIDGRLKVVVASLLELAERATGAA
jgi:excisionase family DNA binding protein